MSSQPTFKEWVQQVGAVKTFGPYTLRNGEKTNYFFDVSSFFTGGLLSRLSFEMAKPIVSEFEGMVKHIYGPAYKGIPLATAVAHRISFLMSGLVSPGIIFDRKESKDHGETGEFVGSFPGTGDSVVLVDDVFTDGTTKFEAIDKLQVAFGCNVVGIVVIFDRMMTGKRTTKLLMPDGSNVPVFSCLTALEYFGRLPDA